MTPPPPLTPPTPPAPPPSNLPFRLARPPAMLPLYLRAALPLRTAGRGPAAGYALAGLRTDPARVARYRDIVGQAGSDRLPLLYPHLLGFGLQLRLMTAPGFPFAALGLVHIRNVVVAREPIPVGAELEVRVHAEPVRPHRSGRAVDLVTVVSRAGRPVWEETSTYLRRERTGRAEDTAPAEGTTPAENTSGAAEHEPDLHQAARWKLPADLGRRYAAVAGDLNPIHLNALAARAFGFRRAIAHGLWTAAAAAAALDGRLPDAVRYEVTFRRPILLPATVRLLTALTPDGAHAQVRGRDDAVHLTGSFSRL